MRERRAVHAKGSRSTAGPSSPAARPPPRAACRERRLVAEFANAAGTAEEGSFDLFAHPAAEERPVHRGADWRRTEELAALRKWHVCRVE